MARRVTPLQYRSMVRQAEAKQRQAINKFNQDVHRHNQKVKSAVDRYNRESAPITAGCSATASASRAPFRS